MSEEVVGEDRISSADQTQVDSRQTPSPKRVIQILAGILYQPFSDELKHFEQSNRSIHHSKLRAKTSAMSKPGSAQTPSLATFLRAVKIDPIETSIERLISYVSQQPLHPISLPIAKPIHQAFLNAVKSATPDHVPSQPSTFSAV